MKVCNLIYTALFLALPTLSYSQKPSTQNFIDAKALEGATISVLAINLQSNDTLAAYNNKSRLQPASTTKLFTTASALHLIGSQYKFKTEFELIGKLERTRFIGDLVVIPSGDPTLGSSLFDQTNPDSLFAKIYTNLQAKGVETIEGSIKIISTPNQDNFSVAGRSFDDVANYYGAMPQEFCWRDNLMEVTLKSGNNVGDPVCLNESTSLSITSYAKASSSKKDSAYLYYTPQGITLQGSIPVAQTNFTIKGVQTNPKKQFINELTQYLQKKGIVFERRGLNQTEIREKQTLATIYSPTLLEITKVTNQKSINLFADGVLLQMAQESVEAAAKWKSSIKREKSFWKEKINEDLKLEDGSGLSSRNLITANQLVKLLTYEFKQSNFSQFRNTLAISGESGTLKASFLSLKGKIAAKSGSKEGVLAYAGYLTNKRNETIAFAIIINNFISSNTEAKAEIEKLFKSWFE